MNTKELLRALGLTAYEAEVYEALVRLECAKVNDLARIVSVPRPQIYVALRGLMDHGMVNETRGQVSIYSAVAPAIAFKGLLKQEEELLKAKSEAIRKLNELVPRSREVRNPGELRPSAEGPAGEALH